MIEAFKNLITNQSNNVDVTNFFLFQYIYIFFSYNKSINFYPKVYISFITIVNMS